MLKVESQTRGDKHTLEKNQADRGDEVDRDLLRSSSPVLLSGRGTNQIQPGY